MMNQLRSSTDLVIVWGVNGSLSDSGDKKMTERVTIGALLELMIPPLTGRVA
jgi:hypothetical protein